ncbi:HNH endonuclease [Gordonia Phage Sephiroth]|uniref:HNH endonuclease n=1 Tax=Gordonia Phage Sephiroth TaxID=2767553 RepID=A0A7G9UZL8_9CAUD|nr:HNH endonuclease [Gordonia Phage Sephiroth]QNN99473.1 HNH endonuclease [Gordonia Phage Sephiroth]
MRAALTSWPLRSISAIPLRSPQPLPGSTSSSTTTTEKRCRAILANRSDGICERCCAAPAQSVHHRRKRGQGGPWTPTNCVHICGDGTRGCHGWIEGHPNAAREEGFHVRSYENEAEVPVLIWGNLVYLDDEGGTTRVDER